MKKILVFFVAWSCLTPLFAQGVQESAPTENKPDHRVEIKFSGGTAFTFVPDFHNTVIASDGMSVPHLVSPANSIYPPTIAKCSSKTRSQAGWFVEAEMGYRLSRNYSLSFSVGVKKLRYDYETEFPGQPNPVNLDDFNKGFGRTTLLYLNITPFNIAKSFLQNRLSVQAGPTLNWLLKDEMNNTLALYDSPEAAENGMPDMVFFDTVGKLNKLLIGLNLGIEHKITGPLSIKVSGQYYFTSLFKEEGLYRANVEKIRPFVLQAGVAFSL
jgi:hypothetical protein